MPIRPDLRKFYGVTWRKVTRPRILARAGNKCEQCRVPNNTDVWRANGGCWLEIRASWNDGVIRIWRNSHGGPITPPAGPRRDVRIVLTVAHLNHTSGDDRDDNLKALCQWCHLNYDAPHHRETRATRKDAARPLIAIAEGAEG
jgi:hypothetical protein